MIEIKKVTLGFGLLSLFSGSCYASGIVGGKDSLPPAYLSVNGFKNCLNTQDMGGWTAYCLPNDKPDACTDDSWSKLTKMSPPICNS